MEAGVHADVMVALTSKPGYRPTVGELREFVRVLEALGFDDYAELDEVLISVSKVVPGNVISRATDGATRIGIV